MTAGELALTDAYHGWFQLTLDDAAGVRHPETDYREALTLIREAEHGVADRDAVYESAKAEWEAVMRVDAVLGEPLSKKFLAERAPKPLEPQGSLL